MGAMLASWGSSSVRSVVAERGTSCLLLSVTMPDMQPRPAPDNTLRPWHLVNASSS